MSFSKLTSLLWLLLFASGLSYGGTILLKNDVAIAADTVELKADSTEKIIAEVADTLPPSLAQHSGDTPNLEFQNTAFVLSNSISNENSSLNEYVPVGQALDSWAQLIAVRQLPNATDKESIVGTFINLLLQQNPDMPYEVYVNDETGDIALEFVIVKAPEGAEFNVFIHTDHPTGEGLMVYQYAERAYGEEIESFLSELPDRRESIVTEVLNYQFPGLAEE